MTDDNKWVVYDKRQRTDKNKSPLLKDRISWTKSDARDIVGSPWYYSFWVFKPQICTHCRPIRSKNATCAWESSKKIPRTHHSEKICTSPWESKESCRKNIGFKLICSARSIIFTRPNTIWFPSFLFSTKCSEWQNGFFRKSGENVRGKLV